MADRAAVQIRGTLFGGFNRRSVADYIELLAAERNAYQARLEESEEACEALNAELAESSAREGELLEKEQAWLLEKEKLTGVSEAHRVRVETLNADLRAMSGKLDEANAGLRDAKAQLAELTAVLEAHKQAEAELEELKSHMVEMEAEARIRAKKLEAAASARSDALLKNCGDMVQNLEQDYSDLREDLLATAEHLRRHLLRLDAKLLEMDALLEEPAARIRDMELIIEEGRAEEQRILGE